MTTRCVRGREIVMKPCWVDTNQGAIKLVEEASVAFRGIVAVPQGTFRDVMDTLGESGSS